MAGLDWSHIKAFSSTGESSSSEEMLFLMTLAGYKPVVEYCGGTEVGGAYLSSTLIHPNSPSCFSARTLGMDSVILDEAGHPATQGELYLIPPALGLSTRLLNKDHHETYFEGCPKIDERILRRHGDEVQALARGYYRAVGRTDDTMNLGGIKVSSVELERSMNRIVGVQETAAIGIPPVEGGPNELIVYAVVDSKEWPDPESLKAALRDAIRHELNPLFRVRDVVTTDRLPRTASNKVMRRTLRAAYRADQGSRMIDRDTEL